MATLVNLPVDADISSVKVGLPAAPPCLRSWRRSLKRGWAFAGAQHLGMTECAGLVCIEPLAAPHVPGSTGLPPTKVRTVAWKDARFSSTGPTAPARPAWWCCAARMSAGGYTDAARNAGMFQDSWLVSGDLEWC